MFKEVTQKGKLNYAGQRKPRPLLPELGHSCSALAIRVFAMFFSPALYSNRTDSSLKERAPRWERIPKQQQESPPKPCEIPDSPQVLVFGVLQTRLFQDGSGSGELADLFLQPGQQEPKGYGTGAFLQLRGNKSRLNDGGQGMRTAAKLHQGCRHQIPSTASLITVLCCIRCTVQSAGYSP